MELLSKGALYLEPLADDETPLAHATGFIARYRGVAFLVTNRHIVTGLDNITNRVLDVHGRVPQRIRVHHHLDHEGELRWATEQIALYDDSGDRRWIEHPSLGSSVDVVAFVLSPPDLLESKPRYWVHDLEDQHDVPISAGRDVSVIGFPYGQRTSDSNYTPIWVRGSIATEPEFDFDDRPVFLVDARTRQGQSGSPVVAVRWQGTTGVDVKGDVTIAKGLIQGFSASTQDG
jgi:S1-C subfamily serine protease